MQHERLKGEFRESISRYYSVQNVSRNLIVVPSASWLVSMEAYNVPFNPHPSISAPFYRYLYLELQLHKTEKKLKQKCM